MNTNLRLRASLAALSLGALALCLVAPSAPASVLYRGRLTQNVNGTTQFDPGTTYDMTFRLYSLPQGGTALCEFAEKDVPIRTDGGFEVLLDEPELDVALTNDAQTAYVGLSLNTERELMPRRQLLALPYVRHAGVASAPGYKPHFETLKAGALTAADLEANSLTVGGRLTTQDSTDSLAIRGLELGSSQSLDLRDHRLTMLGDVSTLLTSGSAYARGDTLATAPADGLAFIYSLHATSAESSFGVVRFCRSGEAITAPNAIAAETGVGVRFYAYLSK